MVSKFDSFSHISQHTSQISASTKAEKSEEVTRTPEETSSPQPNTGVNAEEKAVKDYQTFLNKNDFPNLFIGKKAAESRVKNLASLGESIELQHGPAFSKEVKAELDKIEKNLSQEAMPKSDKLFIKKLTHDILMMSSTIPCQTDVDGKKIYRRSVEALTPGLALDMLKELGKMQKLDLSKTLLLSHLDQSEYKKADLPKKMALLNLSFFTSEAREKIKQDPAFNKVLNSDNLQTWMMACSGSLEQGYLNTCEAVSYCQDILAKVSCLPEAIHISKKAIEAIALKADNMEDGTLKTHVQKTLDKESTRLGALSKKIENSTGKESLSELSELTQEWSHSMQKICLLADPTDPGRPTLKPISDAWLASAVVMTPVILATDVLPNIGNLKKPKMRTVGTSNSDISKLVSRQFSLSFAHMGKISSSELKALNDSTLDPQTRSEHSKKLWEAIFLKGGAAVVMPGHGCYVRASMDGDSPIFLFCDPKQRHYKAMSPDEFGNFILEKRLNFVI